MHAGARRSLQFCPTPDEVQAAREKEAAERLVASIEDKLSNIGPPGSSPLRNVRGDDTISFPPAGHRIVLLELFAGIGTGLEAALRAGLVIDKYIYCDPNNVASNIADTRCKQLLERFPSQVKRSTFYRAFDHQTFPQDVRHITLKHLESLGQLDLVIARWECQGFSRAGSRQGLKDPRSALFLDLVKVLNWARELYPNVAFVLENTHHDLAIAELREDILIVQNYIGKPLMIDAAQCSSYAHRLRNYWTNLAPLPRLELALNHTTRKPNLKVDDILEPGRVANYVGPWSRCQLRGTGGGVQVSLLHRKLSK